MLRFEDVDDIDDTVFADMGGDDPVELDEMLGEAWMKHFEKKTKAKKAKVPGKKNLDELLKAKNKEGKVFGKVGIAESLIAKKVKPKKRGVDALTGEPLAIGKFIRQFPKMIVLHVEKTEAWALENPGELIVCTVIFCANPANDLTCPPS